MSKNKIFKALGVCALATLGLFTFTGCSLIGGDNADVVNGLKNNNSNLEKVIDLLKDQNKKLKEENNVLKDILEEVQNGNLKISAEEAWNIMMIAENKFLLNDDGVRDNLRITSVYDNYSIGEMVWEYYQSSNNGYVSNSIQMDTINNNDRLCYEENNSVYRYEKDLTDPQQYEKTVLEEYDSSEAYAMRGDVLRSEKIGYYTNYLDPSQIVSVEILENGNYNITFVVTEPNDGLDSNYLMQYEITKDYKFVKFVHKGYCLYEESYPDQKTSVSKGQILVTFEYNTITDDYINGLLQEAMSKEITSND